MDFLYSVADGTSVRGLIVYGAGMILIISVLVWASHMDDQRDRRRKPAPSDCWCDAVTASVLHQERQVRTLWDCASSL